LLIIGFHVDTPFYCFVNKAEGLGVALDCLVVLRLASRVHLAFFPENSQNRNMFELIGNAWFFGCKDQILLIFQGIFVPLYALIYRQIPLSIGTLNGLENRLASASQEFESLTLRQFFRAFRQEGFEMCLILQGFEPLPLLWK